MEVGMSTLRNKMMNSSMGFLTLKSQNCPIQIKPEFLEFINVQINQKYEIQITIRNDGKQNEKIRIIYPLTPYFVVKNQTNPLTIAPGLSFKLSVFFNLQGTYDCSSQTYEDRLIIIGTNFKKQVALRASKPNFKLEMPKCFKLGLVRMGKQTKFSVPIKNVGREDVQIGMMHSSSPSIVIEDSRFIIKKESESALKVKVNPKSVGTIEEMIHFPNGQSIILRGVCSEENIQIYNKEGQNFNSYNFGVIFIGQKVVEPFYIANNSSQKIEGLTKILNNNLSEYVTFKIDSTKMAFINRNNPKKVLEQEKNVVLKCSSNKFSINSYQDFENKLIAFKQPTDEQLKLFSQQALVKTENSNRQSSSWNTLTEISEFLYIKIISMDQPIKIPIQFCPVMPKIQLSQDKFQFFAIKQKQIAKIKFKIKNCNQKAITIKLQNTTLFYFEGNTTINSLSSQQFSICFRPLIHGEYLQCLKLSLFDVWVVHLKAYGQCIGPKNLLNKQNMKLNLNKSASLQQIKSTRFLAEQRKKRKQFENDLYLKKKITQRTNMGFTKNEELPVDLIFDACENPKVSTNKKFTIKSMTSTLFFNNDEYLKNLAQKRKALPQSTTARLNIKQIIKFSEELTPTQLSKIQIKCDRLDFGSVFVGSLVQKQLVISNKNNKVILVELDLSNNQSLSETKTQIKKVHPYSDAKFIIKLKTMHLGHIRIPICYVINKQHMFQMDIIANVTLINLGFSAKQLSFSFLPNDPNFQKTQTLVVTNYGTTSTKFMIMDPSNKAFLIASNKQQQVLPNSQSHVVVKYKPLQGGDSGQLRSDVDKMIVKVVGGAENAIKLQGTVFESKYSIKQTQINLSQIFISMPSQNRLTIRNHSKNQTSINIQLSPSSLNEVISLDQKNFVLNSQERKQLPFLVLSHQVRVVKGAFIISSRGGKTYKIPVFINFCFPNVQVVGCSEVNLGNVHIMTNHFQRQIILINRTKTQIKLQANKNDCEKTDYIIQFIAAQQRVELTLRNTCQDSEKDETQVRKQFRKRSICLQQNLVTAKQIKNPKNINKIITLEPGIETKFKMKFIPKIVKFYSLKIPLFLHKALREIEPIPQKIKCRAVQPLFYVNPYSISFSNVIICENDYAHKREFQIINPHDRQVDWQICPDLQIMDSLYLFDYTSGNLGPKASQKVSFYFKPQKQGVYSNKIRLYSNLDKQIQVQLQINGSAVCPRISFNKNLLILPVVPIKTQSKGIVEVQNYGYEAVTVSKIKFSHNFPGVELRHTFLDGKLLSLAKKKLKLQVSFRSEIPLSITTNLQIYDEFGDKIVIPISATADNCILTIYPYLQMNNSTVILDETDNVLKLLISKAFSSKNKQTNLSGSSAVTGNFIKKWCNYELNIHIDSYPDTFVQSRGQLLYEAIIKMTNGRTIIKRPSFTSQDKMAKMLQLHSYYSDVLKALQIEGAFLNHIRPQFLLNMNDYLLFMFHKGYIIEEDEFECLSHESWTVLFYQLCKLYFQANINQKFTQKFNTKQKYDKSLASLIYSQPQILILGFLNQFIGEQKIINFNDQARIFEVIQRIIEKTFKISLGQDLAKLKINADSLMLHQFLILVSKFLYSHLQQFGLSMYLQPNDLFTMGQKQFVLFFISLMQNLIHFQTYSLIQFQSASGQKNQKIIQLENPSKMKKLKYWVKIYGSTNFKVCSKQIQIDPQQKRMLKVTYHCKKNSDQQAQLILVPVKDQQYFTNAHPLNFILKNALISKMVMKKQNLRVHVYDIKTINLDIELPDKSESCEYDVRLIGTQFLDQFDFPNYYLLQPGQRVIKNGKDKCEIKIAPLQMGQLSFKVILVSSTFQQYIYEFNVNVILPNVSHIFKLQSLTTDKQEIRSIKIPLQNDIKEQCLKFHRQLNKQKQKKKKTDIQSLHSMAKLKPKSKVKYQLQFVDQSIFQLQSKVIELGTKQKSDPRTTNSVDIIASFQKPYREYKSQLLVKNQQINDFRIYAISAPVTIKAKIFNIKMVAKARQVLRTTIANKMTPFSYRLQKNLSGLQIQSLESGQLTIIFSPEWIMKQQVDLFLQNPDTFEQHIYKIKLQSKLPQPVKIKSILGSNLFSVSFEFDLSDLKLSQKQLSQLKIKTQINRKHDVSLKIEGEQRKIIGLLHPGQQQEQASIKLMTSKSQQYYQFILNIKNIAVVDLGVKTINQKIGQTQKLIIKQINAAAEDFYYQYLPQPYLNHEIFQSENFNKVSLSNFCVIFKPNKEINCQKLFKFKSNQKQFILKVALNAKKLQPIHVPIMVTQNLQKKTSLLIISNQYEVEGNYQTFIEDQSRFKIQNRTFQMKIKDKVNLKLIYVPKYVGDCAKSKLILKSSTLPQLTYCLEGVSKFKNKQIVEQIQGYEGIQIQKQLCFINEFNQKQRFRFQFSPPQSNFSFDQGQKFISRDLEPKQVYKFKIKNNFNQISQKQNGSKINVIRIKDKRTVKQYILNVSIVKNLEDKKYVWECKARQTIFQTIKLPYSYALKQIKADPEIEKYITFNIDQKNGSQAKVKFSPLKPIKAKIYNILLVSEQMKFRIVCNIKVLAPPVDDIITIRTSQVKQTGVAVFKLTNILKEPAGYRAYFQKNQQELCIEHPQGILDAYGKPGTPITIKFRSDVNNKKVDDRLIVETEGMYWIFKVIGIQQKLLNF